MRSDRLAISRLSTGLLLLGIALGCIGGSDRPDSRETVKEFFAALRNSDSVAISRHVDLDAASPTLGEEFGPSAAGNSGPALLAALTGEGQVRARWLENQIVLGRSNTVADTSWVEVSFIDRVTRVQYYNKMRLIYRDDHWVINSFRTL